MRRMKLEKKKKSNTPIKMRDGIIIINNHLICAMKNYKNIPKLIN